MVLTLQIFYPLFGWIADGWIEQYRAILHDLYSLIIGCVFWTVSAIIKDFVSINLKIILYASIIVNSLGIAIIYANTYPLITDQMIVVFGDELSAQWYCSQMFPITVVLESYISNYSGL